MSWSLQISHGDLALSGTSLGQVTGAQKLVQDLRCALLERMGTDDLHPAFGSLIDGGRRPDGTEIPTLIAGTDWQRISQTVDAEIRRICNDYSARQLARAQADRLTYRRTTLDPAEVLLQVQSISFTQVADTLIASVTLLVGNNITQTLNIPVANEPVITT